MAKKVESVQISKHTVELMTSLQNLGLPVNADEPSRISVYFETDDKEAIIRWGDIMWPLVKKPLSELDIPSLARDGVRIQKTWNWRG